MQLRPPQLIAEQKIYDAWDDGAQNVLLNYGCGGGKTQIASSIIKNHDAPTCAIAHRQELVSQMSIALARNEVRHRIIAPKKIINIINNYHMMELGKSYYDSNAIVGVAGVNTVVRRETEYERWFKSITLWVHDEAHHLLRENTYGKAVGMFPNAKGLGLTATSGRADGKGLGRHADGLIDKLIQGSSERELINSGYLTDYRIFNESNLDRSTIPISKTTGDFTQQGASNAVKNSPIIGDIVKQYLKIAPGKLGITFVPSVEIAIQTAINFNAAGVPAVALHAKTPLLERIATQHKLKNREILQLVNVDLFGEGYDLPAIEVIQMARPTDSYPLYHQQFMRSLRIMISKSQSMIWGSYTDSQRLQFIAESVKPRAIIIDHVHNIDTEKGGHGLPDAPRKWSLDRRERRAKNTSKDVIPTRTCIQCTAVYERFYKQCPECGCIFIPASRSAPEFVDGDLTELDSATLARMRGEVTHANMSIEDYKQELINKHAPHIGHHIKHHRGRQETQKALRSSIAWWAGYQRAKGRPDDESYRRFYIMFGIDVLSAQTLKTKDAHNLAERINDALANQ